MKIDWSFAVSLMEKLDKMVYFLGEIYKENKIMTAQMDALIEAVNIENSTIDGAITLIDGFNSQLATINTHLADVLAQLQVAQADTTALAEVNAEAVALHDEIEAKTVLLAGAVANVPSTPVA
jgi:hypothetical protein